MFEVQLVRRVPFGIDPLFRTPKNFLPTTVYTYLSYLGSQPMLCHVLIYSFPPPLFSHPPFPHPLCDAPRGITWAPNVKKNPISILGFVPLLLKADVGKNQTFGERRRLCTQQHTHMGGEGRGFACILLPYLFCLSRGGEGEDD